MESRKLLSRNAISSNRLLARKTTSPVGIKALSHGLISQNPSFLIEERKRDDIIKSKTWSSNQTGPRPPVIISDRNFDLDATGRRNNELEQYLKRLEKSSKNVENDGSSSISEPVDGSESLSVFSLSSDEHEKRKSAAVEDRKRSSYIKTNYLKDTKEVEMKPTQTNFMPTQNSRISDALLKAQQFSNKYKQGKSSPLPPPDTQSAMKQETEETVENEDVSEKESVSSYYESSGVKEKSGVKERRKSSSFSESSIKSLMNIKDLMLEFPSTSPESKLEERPQESEVESNKSEIYDSDFEVKSESESLSELSAHTNKSSEKLTKSEQISEQMVSKTSEQVSENVTSYVSDFEKSDESTLKSESSSKNSETFSNTASDTVVSAVKVAKPRSTVRNVKMSTKDGKVAKGPSNIHVSRATQTMAAEELNLSNFYHNLSWCSPPHIRPYVYYVDPRLVSSVVVNSEALNEISTWNPNVIVMDDMLHQQMSCIRSLIESQRRCYVGAISALKPNHNYTTWEETKKMIDKRLKKKKQMKSSG